jgi:fibronectin-binding autotransporter adhesin
MYIKAKLFLLIVSVFATNSVQAMFWDANGTDPGAGGATPTGTWGVDNYWSNPADGVNGSGGTATTGGWVDGNLAIFSAGTDANGTFTVNVIGTQTVSGLTFEEGQVTLQGGSIVMTNGIVHVQPGAGAFVNSVLGGPLGLTNYGTGILTLGTNNNYSGNTVLDTNEFGGGFIRLAIDEAIPSASSVRLVLGSTLDLNGFTQTLSALTGGSASSSVALGSGRLILAADGTSNTFAGVISGAGSVTKNGTGTQNLTAINTYSGPTYLNAGLIAVNGTSTLGDGSGTLYWNGGGMFALNSRATAPIANPIVMSNNMTISGSGARTLPFGNTITCVGGTLLITNTAASGLFAARFNGSSYDFNRPITMSTNCQLDLWSTNGQPAQTFSGVISGPGSIRRSSTGNGEGGVSILSGNNVYSGNTALNGGLLGFGTNSTGPAGAVTSGPIGTGTLTIANDPILVGFFAHGGSRSVGNAITLGTVVNLAIVGSDDLNLYGPVNLGTTARTFVVSNSGVTTLSGTLTNAASVTKVGPGTLVLSGNNLNSGIIINNEGLLLVNNSAGSGTGSGQVTVNAGATLGGSGSITGAVTIASGATIGAGNNGVGILTLRGGLSLNGTNVWELAANSTNNPGVDFDQLVMPNSGVTFGGSSVLRIQFTGSATLPSFSNPFWQQSRSWKIINVSGGAPGASFGNIDGTNGITAGVFSTVVDGTGSVILTYTPNVSAPTLSSSLSNAGQPNTTLSWSTSVGVSYQVQYNTDLSTTNWIPLTNFTASGSTSSAIDPNSPPSPKRFYRVIIP